VGKVLLRELTKNKFGGSSYTGLGMATLNLHEYVPPEDETMSQRELTLKLDKLNATIRITITCQIIVSNAEDIDDTMSVLSASSDISEIAASFESDTAIGVSSSKGISMSIKRSDTMIMKDETIPEAVDEEEEDEHEQMKEDEEAVAHPETAEPIITWGPTASANHANNHEPSPIVNEPVAEPTSDPSLSSGLSFVPGTQLLEEKIAITRLQDIKDSRATNESLDLLLRLETYRQDLGERDLMIATQRQELKAQDEEHQKQLFQLRAELAMTKELFKREQLGRNAIAAGKLPSLSSRQPTFAMTRYAL
jgi:hypothetical protein